MGDVKESKMQITPETPGRIPVLNPFESPGDYSNLHEQTLSSPSVFKSTKLPGSLSFVKTPGKFRWSIDQLAVINPVEIDPEDIHRQALYLSHSRKQIIDKDVEDKRQKAIEEFFTKDVIVPSPWTDHEGKQLSEYHSSKCINITSESPVGRKLTIHAEKSNAACQTLLSLPVDFNLENVLDQSPGNLSSSSLRRKLFLDGNGNLSPVRCRSPVQTPSSWAVFFQPYSGEHKKIQFGKYNQPFTYFFTHFLANCTSNRKDSALGEQRKFTFHSPDNSSGTTNSNGITNPCIRSPYIDGCSPIKNWSPMRLEMCTGSTQYRTSLIRIPFPLEAHGENEDQVNLPPTDASSPAMDTAAHLRQLDSDTSPRGTRVVVTAMSITQNQSSASEKELALLQDVESEKENNTVDMVDPVEIADENTWIKEPVDNGSLPMTDFVSGIAFSIENSHICMSPLAESSVLPCESSNIQMDSGYNTQNCGSNIMDTVGADSDAQTLEVENKSQVLNTKGPHNTEVLNENSKSSQGSSP
ncbi:protein aurora borealis isoform X3 [Prionailurus iriomotensis]